MTIQIEDDLKVDITPEMRFYTKINNKVKVGDIRDNFVITRVFRINGKGNAWVDVVCGCGNVGSVRVGSLGRIKACGCGKKGVNSIHGLTPKYPRLVHTWCHMVDRCYNEKCKAYEKYGKVGKKMCELWYQDVLDKGPYILNFIEWSLKNNYEDNLTIDRIDNNKGYSPENCRWITQEEQNKNRTNHFWIEAFGERKILEDWIRDPRCKVSRKTIQRRLTDNWSPEKAITEDCKRQIKLPKEFKQEVIKLYSDGIKESVIAELLSCSKNRVYKIIYTHKRKLKESDLEPCII